MLSVGVARETKDNERRVALDPSAVHTLVVSGAKVVVEHDAGVGAGFRDEDYLAAGAQIGSGPAEIWANELVVKVKEPQPAEWQFFRPGLILFCYLHLAAEPELTSALLAAKVRGYAFETLVDKNGDLPLLAPMSEVAGRSAVITGAGLLANELGTLIGGSAGVPPARVAIIGLGVAGTMAARGCRGLDAEVTGVDVNLTRLREAQLGGLVTATLASSSRSIGELVANTDLVIGAALVPGARAPIVITEKQVASMRPGSVIVDIAIDQGGCVETARPTSHSDPIYVEHGVIHYCVTNIPGRYPRTASRALSAAIAPYVNELIADGESPVLASALNIVDGIIAYGAVAEAIG